MSINFNKLNGYHKRLSALKKYLIEKDPGREEEITEAHDVLNGIIVDLYKRDHM